MSVNGLFLWSKRLDPKRARNKSATQIDMDALKKDVELYPDEYIYERADHLRVSRAYVCNALKRLGVTYKKTLKHPKADQEKRSAFCQAIKKYEEENRSIVYSDESGFAHDMPITNGYALKGKRCFWHT